MPSISLLPGQRIPQRASVVLTSPAEAPEIHHPRVLAVPEVVDRAALWVAVESALAPTGPREEIVVGIDPGPRPGYAVFSAGHALSSGSLSSPEEVGRFGAHLHRRFPERPLRFRVGDGDRIARNRIVNALGPLHRPIEFVDEQGTTPRGHRPSGDVAAAAAIARSSGRIVHGSLPLPITRGDIRNLQRQSREGSGGRFTLPAQVAEGILRGELTMVDALADRQRGSATGPTPTPRRREPS